MARSFSNAKLLSALVVDGFSKHYYQVDQNIDKKEGKARDFAKCAHNQINPLAYFYFRCANVICGGFTRIASSVARSGNSGSSMVKKQGEEIVGSTEKVSVGPRPVTGYYRPENRVDEIDVAELRAIFLNNKN
ncbi:late embryogenis abundant protein 2 [Quercus suber]|uniref:Late embryogenis abundant protein 2 n=1 Tax=Quercus suber TaxID=58331 RepID=A0AAW0LHX2_QUESU